MSILRLLYVRYKILTSDTKIPRIFNPYLANVENIVSS